jgi:ferredoxin
MDTPVISRKTRDVFLLAGLLLYCITALGAVRCVHESVFVPFTLAGMLGVAALYRSVSVFLDLSLIIIVWLFVGDEDPHVRLALYMTLVATVLLYASHKILTGKIAALAAPLALLWTFVAGGTNLGDAGAVPLLMFAAVIPGLAIFTRNSLAAPGARPHEIDLILCSHSSHTAHYAGRFSEGVREGGARVIVHRFHRLRDFRPELRGDALVVAFPVYGWKPPWPLCEYLLSRLPRGGGKPAFILYSSAGGPENAGMVAWLLLTLRGYRVVGKNWCVYPVNIPTFRLGPMRMWRFLDHLVPPKTDIEEARRCGADFAAGRRTGVPFILWPFPLVIAGILLDNRLVDTVLYRNYVWKRRCIRCGLCVRFCPTERLRMEEYPKARGTCALCMGCINLCPKHAMHMYCLTEYGHQYKPRWPELLKGETIPSERSGL